MEYHIFSNKNQNYIYFPMYKQFYHLTKEEKDTIKFKDKNANDLLNSFVEGVSIEEEYQHSKDHRYGLFLNVANACNAKCIYCFAHQGDYGKEKGIMSKKVAIKAVENYLCHVPEYAQANIVFFGGEPMMAYDVIKAVVEYVNKNYNGKNSKYHLVTNGTLFDEEKINFFSLNDFSMAISIDGGEEVQNYQRPLASGKDSFLEATRHLRYLLSKIDNIHARGTYCDFNQSLVSNYKDLIDAGFKEVHIPPDILNAEMNKDFDKLINELDSLYDYIVEYTKNTDDFPFGLFIEQIRRLFLPRKETNYSCGLGVTNFAVDIKGDIYPCHRFTSEDEYKIGTIDEPIQTVKYDFDSAKCKTCWNRFTCSHGCAYNDLVLTKEISGKNKYFCTYSKKMTELAMSLTTELTEDRLIGIIGL